MKIPQLDFGDEFKKTLDDKYTSKIGAPQYIPSGIPVRYYEMYDKKKTNKLIKDINNTEGIPDEIRQFLIAASWRHCVFTYDKIADYYTTAPIHIQKLMEDSALVIIDFNDAIQKGFVKLSDELSDLFLKELESDTE